MIQVFTALPEGATARVVGPDDPHEKSENEDSIVGHFCTTCYRRWPCKYEAAKQYKARVYAKLVRAIASGAAPERVAEAVIHAVQTDNIGYHYEGHEPAGMNLRYQPITVKGI